MNNQLPIISIITVTYNAVQEIEATILSVIDQLYENIEYIIIDGGSTDGTIDIIRRYENRISYWITERDKGIYDAMNKALSRVTGDWIINMNAGDRLLKIPIDQLKDAMDKNYVAVCGKILSEGGLITIPRFDWMMKLRNTLPHQALFYKTNACRKYDTQYKIVADYNLNLSIYLKGEQVLLIDDLVAFHSIIGVSATSQSALESFKVIRKKCGLFFYILSFLYRKERAILFYLRKALK